MKKYIISFIKRLLLGTPIESNYPVLRSGYRTVNANKAVDFNEWAKNIYEQNKKRK